MKFLIIGAGGTGGAIGGFLASSGKDVTFIARGMHLEALKKDGLTLKSVKIGEKLISPIKAFNVEEYVNLEESSDIIFVCVMYYSLDEVVDLIKKVSNKNTVIIPILNVFGTGEKLQKKLPNVTVLDGCIYIFSWRSKPGEIIHNSQIIKVIYGYRKNQEKEHEDKLLTLEKLMNESRIETIFSENIERDALAKFSFVSPMGAAGLYYNCTAGDFVRDSEKNKMFLSLVKEIIALGKGMGIEFQENLIEKANYMMRNFDPTSTTSMQRDVKNDRKSEIDGLIYEVIRMGKLYNVPMPNYEKIANWAVKNNLK
ncbi:ketopantoate reductase family protein [Fusobacterium sp. PH5-44]|uniref:ketopantoate reductase family protein n=1 Tax=unclassified Fusobacterium TaxID=2648384 RepID=UPI003D1929C6